MTLIMDAIQWRWPGARCATQENHVVLWEGPMAEPSPAELAQAEADYVSGQVAAWDALRTERDRLLYHSDWTQITGAPLDETAVLAWASYRQALRDLPANTVNPVDVVWPPPPPS